MMETQNNAPQKHYGIAIIALVVVVVVLLGTSIYFWNSSRTKNTTSTNSTSQVSVSNNTTNTSSGNTSNATSNNTTTNNTTSNSTSPTVNSVTDYLGSHKYVDSKFSFSITLPSTWSSFFAVDTPDSASNLGTGTVGVVTFYTESTSDVWAEVFNPSKPYHYAPAFYVYVYTKDAWDKSNKDITGPHGQLLGEKDGKVFAMNTPQDTAPDLIGAYKKVDFGTFKAL